MSIKYFHETDFLIIPKLTVYKTPKYRSFCRSENFQSLNSFFEKPFKKPGKDYNQEETYFLLVVFESLNLHTSWPGRHPSYESLAYSVATATLLSKKLVY